METYSMTQAESLTGISAHKLRIWERRYSFLKPMRTETNIRFYSAEQLKKLLNVGILSRNGFRISKIDKMSDLEIHENVSDILSNITEENNDEINALVLHMIEYNESEFNKIFQRSIMRKGFLETIIELIYPFLNHVGILWTGNKLIPAQEHFISNLIRQKIITAIDTLPIPNENAPSIVLFLLGNEDHEMGLLLASFIAKDLGWKVYYLGQRVPYDNVKVIFNNIKPTLAMTIFVTPKTESEQQRVYNSFSNINTPLLISGNNDIDKMLKHIKNSVYISNPKEFVEYLRNVNSKSH